LNFTKKQAEPLSSRLEEWNPLHPETEICFLRNSQNEFLELFSQVNELVFLIMVSVIQSLLDTNKIQLDGVSSWTSKVSLNALLLHNGKKFPSLTFAHAAEMKESYENMKVLLEKIQYEKYNWNIGGELNAIALLLGLQLDYPEFCCLLCDCVSTERKHRYMQKQSAQRESLIPGQKRVVNTPSINSENVYAPPFHFKNLVS
jgi:hypothetical protein